MIRRRLRCLTATTLLLCLGAVTVRAASPDPVTPPDTPIDRAFRHLYNFDFAGSLAVLYDAERAQPDNPLVYSVRAGTYLFMEMDRLKILETRFFLNDDNLVDGTGKLEPDPVVRNKLFATLERCRQIAGQRLTADPDDVDALFAMCMAAGVETDYAALVERRTWRSLRLAPTMLVHAKKLLARTPPFYDAYLNFGSLEYVVGDLPFFIRWFIRYDGVKGSKQRGIEQLKLTASQGRYYGPYARILLAVVYLRENRPDESIRLLEGLSREFPENHLFRDELARIRQQVEKRRTK
ncbi:MAG TPA: hypothetical protein PLK89_01525 [Acidobacteriota bacterium]|nr:hypothetical protein [Acidobacteriota bacterium]